MHDSVADDFTASIDVGESTAVIHLGGDLDMVAAQHLSDRLDDAALTDCQSIIVHTEDLTFIDSAGLRMLVVFRQQHGRKVQLASRSAVVERLLEVSGLRFVFD